MTDNAQSLSDLEDVTVVEPPDRDPRDTRYRFLSAQDGASVEVQNDLRHQPDGLRSVALSAGVKTPGVLDFTVVRLDNPGSCAAVFTRNRCRAAVIDFDIANLSDGRIQALVVVSKNANVFTPSDRQDIQTLAEAVAGACEVAVEDILMSCTGVIGVPLPMERLLAATQGLGEALRPGSLDGTAEAILTTDLGKKVCSVRSGEVCLAGMVKGAGMIEPNMATMLAYYFTNLALSPEQLDGILRRVVGLTYNCLSVDHDTSTSDTVALLSAGTLEATPARVADLERALLACSVKLSRDLLIGSEGATKIIEVTVDIPARGDAAQRMAKRVVNSPLVKTAVHGNDPNWGRVVMAMGKLDPGEQGPPFDPGSVRIDIAGQRVFDSGSDSGVDLESLTTRMRSLKRVDIAVKLGEGGNRATAWGCDLSAEYVRINAEYTT